jgi:transducin (beta)-like 1
MVYSVAFSPDGELLVAASADRAVSVYSTKDGSLLRTFTGSSAAYEAAFSPEGDKVAAVFASGAVALVDLHL